MGWFVLGAMVGGFLGVCAVAILGMNDYRRIEQSAADVKLFCLQNDCRTCPANHCYQCIFDGSPAGWNLKDLNVDKNGIDSTSV